MPEDSREIKAALTAGARAWAEYPYLEKRFGERGHRFTNSDSCWLATLHESTQDEADRQVHWLAGILANRGIPTVILISHLELLFEELARAVPPRKESYERLKQSANMLLKLRRKVLSDSVFKKISTAFNQELEKFPFLPANSGPVLLSSFTDDVNGINLQLEAVPEWFKKEWIKDSALAEKFDNIVSAAFNSNYGK